MMPETGAVTKAVALSLRVSNLTIAAPGGRSLMQVGQLALEPGVPVAVRGPSGAGKSTLLHALAGLIRPAAGQIIWGDTDIAALSDDRRAAFRRNHVGLIFQDFLLFEELGALGNAALSAAFLPAPRRAALRARAGAMLTGLGLDATAARRAASFSGGERQRVAVARALANDPAIVLADEPTASLDRASADRLTDELAAIGAAPGRILIVVTHDAALIERMGRVLTVTDGRITGDSHG